MLEAIHRDYMNKELLKAEAAGTGFELKNACERTGPQGCLEGYTVGH